MKNEKNKIDLTINLSRPDLEVIPRLPGAYIVKDGKHVPDLNDEAMLIREKLKVKSDSQSQSEQSEGTDKKETLTVNKTDEQN